MSQQRLQPVHGVVQRQRSLDFSSPQQNVLVNVISKGGSLGRPMVVSARPGQHGVESAAGTHTSAAYVAPQTCTQPAANTVS